jgi:hypothetical protein
MAKKQAASTTKLIKHKKRRPGVHSKKKASKCKGSKNYVKKYIGQG